MKLSRSIEGDKECHKELSIGHHKRRELDEPKRTSKSNSQRLGKLSNASTGVITSRAQTVGHLETLPQQSPLAVRGLEQPPRTTKDIALAIVRGPSCNDMDA